MLFTVPMWAAPGNVPCIRLHKMGSPWGLWTLIKVVTARRDGPFQGKRAQVNSEGQVRLQHNHSAVTCPDLSTSRIKWEAEGDL